MFDTSVVQSIFPDGEIRQDGSEIINLDFDTQPQGRILISADKEYSDQTYYIIETENHFTMLRLCIAYPDSGYDQYAVILYQNPKDNKEEFVGMLSAFTSLTGVQITKEQI